MKKQEILEELKKQFELTKKKLNFKASYDEINNMSYIEDMALSQGFVSNQFPRQMINRIVETFYGWVGEIYSWIYTPQMDLIHGHEGKRLSEQEKKELLNMIDRIMYLVRKNKRIAFQGLIEKQEGEFVDELVEFDKKYFNPFMLKYHKKFENIWKQEIDKN